MNNQQTFDRIVAHLRQQKRQSVNDHSCLYRGPNGTSCAVGCLIPDDLYDPKMEGNSVESVCDVYPSVGRMFREWGVDPCLLTDMQRVHDDFHNPGTLTDRTTGEFRMDALEAEFLRVAARFNLVYTPPTGA